MSRELRLYLRDIVAAAEDILRFTFEKSQSDYEQDRLLRRAVERSFEIIGEALNQARNAYPLLKERIPEHNEIVLFRHRIIHGYFVVDDQIVWSVVKIYLPPLLAEIKAFQRELDGAGAAAPDGGERL